MAEKTHKSHAEKAAAASKTKNKKKQAVRNGDKNKPVTKKQTTNAPNLPLRLISALVCLGLFVLFLVIFFWPGGVVTNLIGDFIHGLIGNAGFIVAIPVLLYLFVIHAFSGKRPVKLRTICLVLFTVICG